MSDTEPFAGYAVVEVMGHNRYVGHVTETTLAGAGVLRVDVPPVPATEYCAAQPGYTKYIPPASLYALTPITEEEFARMRTPEPPRLLYGRYEPDHEIQYGVGDDRERNDEDDELS